MLVDTKNLVSSDEFRRDFDRFAAAAREGGGPVAVTRDSEVIGFFIGPDEYEAVFGAAVRDLLTSREKEETVSQDEAREHVRATIRRHPSTS